MNNEFKTANENSDESSNDALIDLAYAMAIEPHRYRALTKVIDTRLQEIHGDKAQTGTHNLAEIGEHFDRAFDMLERQGRHNNAASGSIRFVDSDTRPSLLLHEDGRVFHANQPARDTLKFSQPEKLSPERFQHDEYNKLLRDLKTITAHDTNQLIAVYNIFDKGGDQQIKMALAKAIDYKGNAIGRLFTFHIKWLPEMARQFQESFNLSPADLAITKAIVTGKGLKEEAAARGSKLATVRTQAKALRSKLGVHSQIELACLYSGFTQLNLNNTIPADSPELDDELWRKKSYVSLPSGRQLHYEAAGPVGGRPVLFFHALIGGLVLTQPMRHELDARNIRLIMVWRPFFAGSDPDGTHKKAPEKFARDVENLLDHLDVETCQILGVISGAIYAYACAQLMPKRIVSIVSCGGSIPIASRAQFKLMKPNARVAIYLARYTPQLLPMLLRSMFSSIDAGYDYELVQSLYDKSPHDQMVFDDKELRSLVQHSFPECSVQGYKSFVRDIHVQASKWGHILNGVTCPVTLLHGKLDPAYPIESISTLIKEKHNFDLVQLGATGQLAFFQHPRITFKTLDTQFENQILSSIAS